MRQGDAFFLAQRAVHGIGVDRLDTDDPDFRLEALDVSGNAGDQSASAHRHENGMNRPRMLAQDLHAYGALARDDLRVVIGVDESQLALLCQDHGVDIGVAVGIAVQHHVGAAALHGFDFYLRGGGGHHDGGFALQALRRQRHPLGMVAGGSRDHPALERCGRKLHHLVVGPAQLEREYRLQILALEHDRVADAARQVGREFQRAFDRHVVDAGGEYFFQVVVVHGP